MNQKRLLISIVCLQLILGFQSTARAQLGSSSGTAFLEYMDKAQGPSDYIVKRFPNQKLVPTRLIGGVQRPGFYQIPENTSLLSLMSYSGGALPSSDIRSVTILRQEPRASIEIDVEKILKDPTTIDPIIHANDVIFVRERKPIISSDTMALILVTSTVAAIILSSIAISDRFNHPFP